MGAKRPKSLVYIYIHETKKYFCKLMGLFAKIYKCFCKDFSTSGAL